MATRLYPFDLGITPPISPAFSAGWEGTASALRCNMDTVPATSGPGAYTVAGSAVAGDDHLQAQHIYGPLAAQTIGGTIKGQLMAREENTAVDARAQLRVYVVSASGGTVRGILLEMSAAALSSEYGTVYANRKFPLAAISPATLTSVAALFGDYLVIEQGFRQHGTNATGSRLNTSVLVATDLPEDETATSGRPWFELSQTLILASTPIRSQAVVV